MAGDLTAQPAVTGVSGRHAAQVSDVIELAGVSVEVPGRRILDGLDLRVAAGETVAVMGPSGSGKTTLLNCVAGITRPSAGRVTVAGLALTESSERTVSAHRLRNVGIVFQFGELLPELTVEENVALPARFAGMADAAERSRALLLAVGLDGFGGRTVDTLSGGEAQRVAIARALVAGPPVVLADEPTGALDETTGADVVATLVASCTARGAALVLVTHDPAVAAAADRVLRLRGGALEPHPQFLAR